jgi:serine/threonine-protein phosphatase 2A regulatory subunit B
VVDEGY